MRQANPTLKKQTLARFASVRGEASIIYLAREIMKIATSNNVGIVEETDSYFMQYGVNFFTNDTNLLLIGGTIYHKCIEGLEYHGKDLELIASGALYDDCEGSILRPSGQVFMDAQYLVSILGGFYGRLDPERALRMMKRFLQKMEVREELCKRKNCYYLGIPE